MAKTNTLNITDVIKNNNKTGDKLTDQWNENNDLKVIQTAQKSYSIAINALKAQLIYKKMTGEPGSIKFLED